jgi:phospholipid/cholesterol/gamma-HCH transport system substrate-binding protein
MKTSKETKVGITAAILILALIFGVRFLKGDYLSFNGKFIYVKFDDVTGLDISDPINVNGLKNWKNQDHGVEKRCFWKSHS